MLRPKDLHKRIMSTPVNKRVFSLGGEAYIVGGYLRDLMQRGVQGKDIDYVLDASAWDALMNVLPELGGTVVELRQDQVVRVAFTDGRTLDFSRLAGDIVADLRERDFTVNAVAWSPGEGIIDPTGGVKDIVAGIIRAVSERNLQSDPLRLLRAYRFSAELSWPIDRDTRGMVSRLHGLLKRSATERITLEFIKLLSARRPENALLYAFKDGLLGEIIFLSDSGLRRNIKRVSNLTTVLKEIPERLRPGGMPQGLSYEGLLRLEALLIGSSSDILSLSRSVRERATLAAGLYDKYRRIGRLGKPALYRLFRASGEAAVDLMAIAGRAGYIREYCRFRRIVDRPVIKGDEVMAVTGIGQGPAVGRLLEEINSLRFQSVLGGRASAARWLLKQKLM